MFHGTVAQGGDRCFAALARSPASAVRSARARRRRQRVAFGPYWCHVGDTGRSVMGVSYAYLLMLIIAAFLEVFLALPI